MTETTKASVSYFITKWLTKHTKSTLQEMALLMLFVGFLALKEISL